MLARVYLFWAGEHKRDGKPADAENKSYFERASYFGQKVRTQGHTLAANYWDPFIDMCSDKYNTTANEVSGKLSLPETERETCVRKAVSETRSGFSVRTFLLYLML